MILASCMNDVQRRRYRLLAFASTWTGCMSEVLFDSSAIVLLFITALGGSEALTMFSTGFSSVAWAVLLIPCSELARKKGLKWCLSWGVYLGMAGIFLLVLSPCLGRYAMSAALAGCAVFAISRPVHLAAWTPLLNGILRKDERGSFFGFMRFSYQLIAMILFSSAGFFMGDKPPVWVLQLVIGICGLLLLGRKLCIDRIPAVSGVSAGELSFKKQLRNTMRNSALMSFAVYCGGIFLTTAVSLPLTLLYLKNSVSLGSGTIQLVAVCGTVGTMTGYLSFGYLLRRFNVKKLLLASHLSIIFFTCALTFCVPEFSFTPGACAVILLGQSFAAACFTNCFSTEMLALSRPGQYTTSTAICSAYNSVGRVAGSWAVSFAMGSGLLAASWQKGGLTFTHYQTIELVCAGFALILLAVLPTVPAIIPDREDYYDAGKK